MPRGWDRGRDQTEWGLNIPGNNNTVSPFTDLLPPPVTTRTAAVAPHKSHNSIPKVCHLRVSCTVCTVYRSNPFSLLHTIAWTNAQGKHLRCAVISAHVMDFWKLVTVVKSTVSARISFWNGRDMVVCNFFIPICSFCRGPHADVNIWSIPLFFRFFWDCKTRP